MSLRLQASTSSCLQSLHDPTAFSRFVAAAGEGGVPAVDFVAYNGGMLKIGGYYWPVIIDLASTKQAPSVLMLWNHDADTVIGHVDGDMKIQAKKVTGRAKLSGDNDRTKEVKATGANGMPWQTSLGWENGTIEFVDSQSKIKVNGQTFTGPCYVTRENVIREVSIVSMGADAGTSVTFAASYSGGPAMFEEWCTKKGFDPAKITEDQKVFLRASFDIEQKGANKDPVPPPPVPPVPSNPVDRDRWLTEMAASAADERQRIDSINTYAAEYNNPTMEQNGRRVSIASVAIRERWTADKAGLEMMRAGRPSVPATDGRDTDDPGDSMRILCAAFAQTCHSGLSRAGMTDDERRSIPRIEDRGFDEKTLDKAHKRFKSRMGPQELLYEAARLNGYAGGTNVKANLKAMLRAAFNTASAFSTFDLPTFLTENFNTFLLAGYNSVDQTWRTISAIGRVADFKEVTNLRLTGSMNFEKVAPDGHIPHGDLHESDYGNKADTYGKMMSVTRQDWYNDNLGAFTQMPRLLGRGGALGLVRAFWTEFMNNSTFFAAGNNNVSSGALSIAGLNALHAVFAVLKDAEGEFINAALQFLLVPVGLYPLALQLFRDTTVVSGNTTPAPNSNPWVGKFQPLTTPYLTDSTITGNSSTAYYGLANPNDVPTIEVVFLDGIETPIVESADVDFSQLGVQWRGYFDWGVRKQDPNGGVRSTGV